MACERKSSLTLAPEKMSHSSVDTLPGHFLMGVTALFKAFMKPLFHIFVLP